MQQGCPFGEEVGYAAWRDDSGSHEALELVGDSEVNLLVQGPHLADAKRTVFDWYEMCDEVQAETYEIDGVVVSNFLLPLYFTRGEEKNGRFSWACP